MNNRLVFENGSSNKEYNVSIVPQADGYVVNFAYGRIGSALQYGSKTPSPVDHAKATKIANGLLNQKIKKGYVPDGIANADAITATRLPEEVVMLPQLANPIEVHDAVMLCNGDLYGQLKKDGERRMMIYNAGESIALNRRGVQVNANPKIKAAFESLCNDMVYDSLTIDAEDMGGYLYVFDVLEWNGNDVRSLSFSEREPLLRDLEIDFTDAVDRESSSFFAFAPTVLLTEDIIFEYILSAKQWREEGVILRTASGVYQAGRPNSGGDVLKIKFTNDASFFVTGHTEGKRSVSIAVIDGDSVRNMGNVTIPANAEIPSIDDVIDVTYLWVIGAEGSLIQPVYKRNRTDEILKSACIADQLVYRDPSIMEK